jgi:hypothetical protein
MSKSMAGEAADANRLAISVVIASFPGTEIA